MQKITLDGTTYEIPDKLIPVVRNLRNRLKANAKEISRRLNIKTNSGEPFDPAKAQVEEDIKRGVRSQYSNNPTQYKNDLVQYTELENSLYRRN